MAQVQLHEHSTQKTDCLTHRHSRNIFIKQTYMRKPWNLPSYPIYSLLTRDAGGKTNYNIMSYVIPVSMHPKYYVIALYSGTQSLKNWQKLSHGILQLLSPSHAALVRILGKKSGKDYNKTAYLTKK